MRFYYLATAVAAFIPAALAIIVMILAVTTAIPGIIICVACIHALRWLVNTGKQALAEYNAIQRD